MIICVSIAQCLEFSFQRGVEEHFRELHLFISSEADGNKILSQSVVRAQCSANGELSCPPTSNRRQVLPSHKEKPESAEHSEIIRLLPRKRSPYVLAFIMCNTLYIYTYITLILYRAHMHFYTNILLKLIIPRAYSNCMGQHVTEMMVTVGDNSETLLLYKMIHLNFLGIGWDRMG